MGVDVPRFHREKPDHLAKACKNLTMVGLGWVADHPALICLEETHRLRMTFLWRERQPCSGPPHVVFYPLISSQATGLSQASQKAWSGSHQLTGHNGSKYDSKAEQLKGRELTERVYQNDWEVITLLLMAGKGRREQELTGSWLGNT